MSINSVKYKASYSLACPGCEHINKISIIEVAEECKEVMVTELCEICFLRFKAILGIVKIREGVFILRAHAIYGPNDA